MIEYETEYDRTLNKAKDRLGHYGTLHRILIDGKKPDKHVLKAVDQIVSLRRSTIWSKVATVLDKAMMEYFELPDEKQERSIPEIYIARTKAVANAMKNNAEYYAKYKSDKIARPPMYINDENDKTTTVIDIDYFKPTKVSKIVDFPYGSVAEIMKDKNLSCDEKITMCDNYMEAKMNISIAKPIVMEVESSVIDTIKEYSMDDDDDDVPLLQYEKTTMPPKDYFKKLCAKYPSKFVMAKVGSKGKVGWFKNYRKEVYTPTLITLNPAESDTYELECLRDSTVKYMSDSYFVKGLDCSVYFVRTT